MKSGNKILLPIFFLLTLFIGTDYVQAEEQVEKVCLDSGFYSIKWNPNISTNFKLSDVTDSNIEIGNTAPVGVTDVETYKFEKTQIANKCYKDSDGTYYSCPTPEDLSVSFNDFVKLKDDNTYQNITTQVNSDFTIRVAIKNIYSKVSSEVSLRYVPKSNANTQELELSKVSGGFLTLSDGNWVIPKVTPGSLVYIEVYLKKSTDSNCDGTMLGTFEFYVDDLSDYELDNPALKNPTGYGCDVVKDNTKIPESYKKSAVPECYSTTILYSEYSGLKDTIQKKWERALTIYNDFPDRSDFGASDFTCTDGSKNSINNNVSISQVGTYWSLSCYETYNANPNGPKLVKAGSGFEYDSIYTVSRTCTINQISKPTKKTKCSTNYWSTCTYPSGEITNISDPSRGGPSEDFDACIQICDGGTYTQSCINSCYKKIYGSQSNRQLNFSSQLTYNISRTTIVPLIANPISTKTVKMGVSVLGTLTPTNCTGYDHVCISQSGKTRMCKTCTTVLDGHTFTNEISDYCGNHGTSCTYYREVTPNGCSVDPETEYASALSASQSELRRFEALAASYENINNGNYEIKIQDSYLKDSDGKSYVFTVNSTNNPQVTIKTINQENIDAPKTVVASASLGNSGGASVMYNQKTVRTKVITVSLPASYISKVTGEATYATDNDTKNGYLVNTKTNKPFEKLDVFNVDSYYQKEYRYYTSFWSNNINVDISDNKVVLQTNPDFPNNIMINSSNVGTGGGFSSDISCYYGVYNNFYCKDPKDCPDENTGIQWIYRPIDLTDVFPNNRSPRWNWTGTLGNDNTYTGAARYSNQTALKYNINPTRLIEEIESKGNSIYDVQKDSSEVDYEFVLTKENLKNIRNYNKNVLDYNGDGSHNYLDYNMNCYKDSSGKEICTSKFLDNITGNSGTESNANFITYSVAGFTMDARKNIAGCNNSKNGVCVEIGR